jgi:hypothetical protein
MANNLPADVGGFNGIDPGDCLVLSGRGADQKEAGFGPPRTSSQGSS